MAKPAIPAPAIITVSSLLSVLPALKRTFLQPVYQQHGEWCFKQQVCITTSLPVELCEEDRALTKTLLGRECWLPRQDLSLSCACLNLSADAPWIQLADACLHAKICACPACGVLRMLCRKAKCHCAISKSIIKSGVSSVRMSSSYLIKHRYRYGRHVQSNLFRRPPLDRIHLLWRKFRQLPLECRSSAVAVQKLGTRPGFVMVIG